MYLLVADAGNTSITFGLFSGARLLDSFFCPRRAGDEPASLRLLIEQCLASCGIERPETVHAIIGSVSGVPEELISVIKGLTGSPPEIASTTAPNLGMAIAYADPTSLGIDRLANAIAAYDWLQSGAIVVDLGTATQFDCVSRVGTFVGGAICIGAQSGLDALSTRSSRLPPLSLSQPAALLATDTATALLSGAFYGQAALIDGMVERLRAELGKDYTVIATGGFAPIIGPHCRCVEHIRPDLTLQGLRLIWERVKLT